MNRRHLLALLSVVLLAACSAASGDLGSLPPATATDQPSIDVPSGEPTPGETEPGASPELFDLLSTMRGGAYVRYLPAGPGAVRERGVGSRQTGGH